jgi:hypothetical protein
MLVCCVCYILASLRIPQSDPSMEDFDMEGGLQTALIGDLEIIKDRYSVGTLAHHMQGIVIVQAVPIDFHDGAQLPEGHQDTHRVLVS